MVRHCVTRNGAGENPGSDATRVSIVISQSPGERSAAKDPDAAIAAADDTAATIKMRTTPSSGRSPFADCQAGVVFAIYFGALYPTPPAFFIASVASATVNNGVVR